MAFDGVTSRPPVKPSHPMTLERFLVEQAN
jgi:hypothetical protein